MTYKPGKATAEEKAFVQQHRTEIDDLMTRGGQIHKAIVAALDARGAAAAKKSETDLRREAQAQIAFLEARALFLREYFAENLDENSVRVVDIVRVAMREGWHSDGPAPR